MTKTEGAAAMAQVQKKVTGVKKLLAHFKKKLTTAKKQVIHEYAHSHEETYLLDIYVV